MSEPAWRRSPKPVLAHQIHHLLWLGMKPGGIAKALGKSRERIRQIRLQFELPDWKRKLSK